MGCWSTGKYRTEVSWASLPKIHSRSRRSARARFVEKQASIGLKSLYVTVRSQTRSFFRFRFRYMRISPSRAPRQQAEHLREGRKSGNRLQVSVDRRTETFRQEVFQEVGK